MKRQVRIILSAIQLRFLAILQLFGADQENRRQDDGLGSQRKSKRPAAILQLWSVSLLPESKKDASLVQPDFLGGLGPLT